MNLTGMALILLAIAVALGFALDLHRRMQRTRILQLPGGLRFEAYHFSVQIQRREQEVRARCARAVLALPGATVSLEAPQAERVEHTFAAVGFSVALRERNKQMPGLTEAAPKGDVDIVLQGADGTLLTIERVSRSVAVSFQYFYLQVRHWIDKLEQRLERERVARLRSEEEGAQAQRDADVLAQLLDGRAPNAPLTAQECEAMAAAQIAQWRSAAGFEGQHSLHQVDATGRVLWFVDLAADGRITLHADKRTLHTTLRGASITVVLGELEVGVRDAHWTEDEPELRVFRVLKGRSAEERRAWKERMELMRRSLDPK